MRKSLTVHRWMFGVSYHWYGRRFVTGMRRRKPSEYTIFHMPKFGNETTPVGATRHLEPDRISGACLGIANGRTEARESFGAIVGTAFSYLAKRWTDASGERDAAARGQVLRHVCEMALLEFALSRRTQEASSNPAGEVVAIVEDYIARRHGRDCSLEKLERLTGYSRFHLSRLFHRQRGKTIGQAIDASRLRFLADAEAQGLKQCSIAEALGFSSPSAFCLWKRRNLPAAAVARR